MVVVSGHAEIGKSFFFWYFQFLLFTHFWDYFFFRLPCGHSCEHSCHSIDREHMNAYKNCSKACDKIVCERGHRCPKVCHYDEECGECMVRVEKLRPQCGHIVPDLCSGNANTISSAKNSYQIEVYIKMIKSPNLATCCTLLCALYLSFYIYNYTSTNKRIIIKSSRASESIYTSSLIKVGYL